MYRNGKSFLSNILSLTKLYDLDIEMASIQSILSQRLDDPNYRAEEEALKSLAINSLIRNYLVLDFLEKNEITPLIN